METASSLNLGLNFCAKQIEGETAEDSYMQFATFINFQRSDSTSRNRL